VTASNERILVRGAGDLATGVISRLHHAGLEVGATELEHPLTVRRTVAFSTAMYEGSIEVERVTARRVDGEESWSTALERREIPIVGCAGVPSWLEGSAIVVDARLGKRNIDTSADDGQFVIALGPGFVAGEDCHAVIETQRGHRLGRIIARGSAQPDTDTPGIVQGRGRERVIRAPGDGHVDWVSEIGAHVATGALLGSIGADQIRAPFDGVVRGLIHRSCRVRSGMKIGDIDPRPDTSACDEISDKALAIGGAVLTAMMGFLAERQADEMSDVRPVLTGTP